MHYHIDKTAAQSAYLQLYHQLRRDIVSGVYPLGTKMPSKRLIATETGVSVITVEHALAILCDEGYLESRERSGFFVSFAAADCFPVSETETERRMTVSHGTEDEFPFPSLAKTMRRVLSEYGESILVKSPNNGCAELRGTIAAYLSRSRGISVQPGQIVIGSGAEYLYGLIVQLLGRERVFALEDPSYDKIRRVYQAHGVTCEMLRLGSDGIRSDELTRASATVLHVTPFHSFPSLHKKILKDAGLPHIRFHDLRHTFATLALQNGVDVKTVSSMLGHYDAGFTLRTYTHATRQMQQKAAEKMGSFMAQIR